MYKLELRDAVNKVDMYCVFLVQQYSLSKTHDSKLNFGGIVSAESFYFYSVKS